MLLEYKPMLKLFPAYGRRCYTRESLREDWKKGQDFKIERGPYTSIRDYSMLEKEYKIVLVGTGTHLELWLEE